MASTPDDPNRRRSQAGRGKLLRLSVPVLGLDLVEFTSHALDRMRRRDVSAADVLMALQKGRGVPGPQLPGRKRVRWQQTIRKSLDVVYQVKPDRLGIITVIPFMGSLRRR